MSEQITYLLVGGSHDGGVHVCAKEITHPVIELVKKGIAFVSVDLPQKMAMDGTLYNAPIDNWRIETETYTLRTIAFYQSQSVQFYAEANLTDNEAFHMLINRYPRSKDNRE